MTFSSLNTDSLQFSKEPIAIVGSGCRFSGEATTTSKLWDLLRNPRDVASTIPESRFNVTSFYDEDGLHHGTSNVTESYILTEDHRHFDAQFFGIKPIEAASMDPQQRILLETVYEGLESAGISLGQLQGSNTGVFVGVMTGDYGDMLNKDVDYFPTYHATGTSRAILSNRISYFFDWHGPSMTIDTACSSSLIALHQAVQVLRSGESPVAIAAGTNLILGPEPYIAESKLKMLSPNGRSRMWDADADGYARGDGIAAVVLKTLSAALRDGDHIQGLVRETGTNQDGRTKGITMPSSTAQAELIRDTYARAGLDISKPADRPQFFEAHGTGTPAGDPIEASAISNAFFSGSNENHQKLFVGSIKTVLGHTEGTAGLAGVLKAISAIQHGVVPPNLLFNRLSPAVEPYYKKLLIPTSPQRWPETHGGPRRVSVNSFGFGGANAHAILERYEPGNQDEPSTSRSAVVTPYLFSASTESALSANLRAYSDFIKANQHTLNANDLAWTLHQRRSLLPYRASFPASSLDQLLNNIGKTVSSKEPVGSLSARHSGSSTPSILGIFTGQGAQWAGMGRELILSSRFAAGFIGRLEDSLERLPQSDRPAWSLAKELLADASTSRIGEAALSQPLCTAVQVLLVELLHAAGIGFRAVVGHSSGEIAAAYASGAIASAEDAVRIAYYRGLHARLAEGPEGQKGAMLAVGTSLEDAQELVALEDFEGRVTVAASNSPASVTLSGDEDAIIQAKNVFEEEKKFVRLLKVDKAYHSHHMLKASESYLKSIRAAGIAKLHAPNGKASWFSSVNVQEITSGDDVPDTYWNDNMVNPVLFSQAVTLALSDRGPFDFALEVGPHPALQGPVKQTLQSLSNTSIPYSGTLARGSNDVAALSAALGQLWKTLPETYISFSQYDSLLSGGVARKLLVDLPTYQWDHSRVFWHESRVSRAARLRKEPPHILLGTRIPDGSPNQLRWKNVLRPREIPWITGHQIQGQTVFPAAAYLSAVVEAARYLGGSNSIRLIEILDVAIDQAIPFDDEDASTETLFAFSDIERHNDTISGTWSFSSAPNSDSLNLVLNAKGKLLIKLGEEIDDLLPVRTPEKFNLLEVGDDRFYTSLDQVGYHYEGPFRALKHLHRRLGFATGSIAKDGGSSKSSLLVHPGPLDAAIQSVILAFCWPGDGRLKSIHVPTNIKRIRLNPSLWLSKIGHTEDLAFDASIAGDSHYGIEGDVDIFTPDRRHNILQIEQVLAKPFSVATASDDFHLFSEMVWNAASPDGEAVAYDGRASEEDYRLAYTFERVAHFYLRRLVQANPLDRREALEEHHQSLLNFADHVVSSAKNGKHQYIKKQWLEDTHDIVLELIHRFPESIDLRIMHSIGEHLPAVVRGETTILEHMRKDNMLDEYYVHAIGFHPYMRYLSRIVAQLVHRYPHMNILEIGAGTGGATKYILREIDDVFASYSFTDISGAFFEEAQTVFSKFAAKMKYKPLNIEEDPTTQGFEEHSYDLIIASLVLHATENLEDTLKNVRKLLKPGGHLVILEITNNGQARLGFVFGGLPGWWLGRNDHRILSPCVSAAEWDKTLAKSGFRGIDTITPDLDPFPYPISVIASQAVDERVDFLRNPLCSPLPDTEINDLTILGGATAVSLQLIGKIIGHLHPFANNIYRIDGLTPSLKTDLPPNGTVISLLDLDARVFKPLNDEKIDALKNLFQSSKTVIWITRNAKTDDAIANMSYGFGRTLLLEMPHLRLQFLDLGAETRNDARIIAETVLRFQAAAQWENRLDERLLWSTEPELSYDNGRYLIPRLKLNKQRNARYNSAKRLIYQDINKSVSAFKISYENGTNILYEVPPWASLQTPNTATHELVKVAFSSLQAIKTPQNGHLYLVLGYTSINEPIVTFTDILQSNVWLPKHSLVSIQRLEGLEVPQFLINFILATTILNSLSRGDHAVLLDANKQVRQYLAQAAEEKEIDLTFLTTTALVESEVPISQIQIHANSSRRELKSHLPAVAAAFVSFSDSVDLATEVRALLPETKFDDLTTLANNESRPAQRNGFEGLIALLQTGVKEAERAVYSASDQISNLLSLTDFPLSSENAASIQLINWQNAQQEVSVQVQPIESTISFHGDRTYWLLGLTGGLGLSLCSWMVAHGARHIVISSRNPNVDPIWLESFTKVGANINVWANDITERESVKEIFDRIRTTLPPLAGIAQGAMVLHDSLFVDLNFDKIYKVLAPKTKGSYYLEKLLGDHDLDFHIAFSSMVAVTGNGGQSHYAAANSFMTALAASRRKRGLASSVIHIGAIVGTGYVTRELTETQQKALRSYGNIWMSEQDFHQIFAEAVISSHPRNNLHYEIMTGLRIIDADAPDKTTWYYNPIFGHNVVYRGTSESQDSSNKAGAPARVQLHDAITIEEVAAILRRTFTYKLQLTLQMNAEEAQQRFATLDAGADELGIDSLVAVEIRSWFLKDLDVDLPVLKILGGASIGDLLAFALEKLPPALVPNLGKSLDIINTAELLKNSTHSLLPNPAPSAPEKTVVVEDVEVKPVVEVISSRPSPLARSQSSYSSSSLAETSSSIGKVASVQSWDAVSVTDLPSPSKAVVLQSLKLSSGQARFYFLQQYLTDKTTFNITCSISLHGAIRILQLEQAIATVVNKHAALRTKFYIGQDGEPRQGILEKSPIYLQKRDVQNEAEILTEFEKLKEHVYDLENGQIMMLVLLSLSSTKHQFLIGYHHVNFDGVSLEVFLADIQKAYDGYSLDTNVLQYFEYAERQERKYISGQFKSELSFWRKQFSSPPPVLDILPVSSKTTREALSKYAFHNVDIRLDSKLARAIETVSRGAKSTPFHFHIAALRSLLIKLVDTDDLSIGIADGNRRATATQNSLGPYINLIPLRFKSSRQQMFVNAIKEAKAKAHEALANSGVPFDVLLSELQIPRSASHTPLFQVLVNYRLGIEENRPFIGCATEGLQFESGRTSDDIVLDIVDNVGGSPLVKFNVQQSLYTKNDAQILLQSYVALLEAFAQNPSQSISSAPLYKPVDIKAAIQLGRGTFVKSRWEPTVAHQVDRLAKQHFSDVAVIDQATRWTYQQLTDHIVSIARRLSDAGVKHGDTVAVFLEPSAYWIASFLAIQRLGAIYVPLDPQVHLSRLSTIILDSRPAAVVVHGPTESSVQRFEYKTDIINVDVEKANAKLDIPIQSRPDQTAALIYTSGTTGLPKGIAVTNLGLLNQIEAISTRLGLGREIVLQQGAYSFDISIWQALFALANGGSLVIASKSTRVDQNALLSLIRKEEVTVIAATPSEFQSWLALDGTRLRQSKLRLAVAGGERVTPSLLSAFRQLRKHDLRLFNAYGPSEISIASNAGELHYQQESSSTDLISVGPSLPNYSVYILNEKSQPVPVGVPGEVYIGGAGVSRGYLNNQALTDQRFVLDEYASDAFRDQGWTIAHRSGDRGRLLDSGALIIEGRIDGDTQIKLRGVRIDLQDIESTIVKNSSGLVQDVVVSLRQLEQDSPEFLVAHVVLSKSLEKSNHDLNSLRNSLPLPKYMVPAIITQIAKLPLSVSGKVSRLAIKQLPLPDLLGQHDTSISLTSEEEVVKGIWEEILSQKNTKLSINPATDFFQAGGNSLLLVQLQKKIKERTGATIPLVALFESITLREMARRISGTATKAVTSSLDWNQEIQLPSRLASSARQSSSEHQHHGPVRVVILTGSTGFLGRSLVRELLEDRNIEKIHAIAVRSPEVLAALATSWKVEIHSGDLTAPLLGLDATIAGRIFQEADAVIHNGADVSFLKTYHSLRSSNVQSTKELIQLSVTHGLSFHYVSTAGVAQLTGLDEVRPVTLGQYYPPRDGNAGYISSKWVSEQLLEKANKEYGLRVSIHRPSNITGDGAPADDIMQNLINFSRQLGVLPKWRKLKGYLNFVPLEVVSQNIINDVVNEKRDGAVGEVVVTHRVNEVDIPLSGMRKHLEKESGRRFKSKPLTEWLVDAKKAGLNEVVATYLTTLESSETTVVLPRLLK